MKTRIIFTLIFSAIFLFACTSRPQTSIPATETVQNTPVFQPAATKVPEISQDCWEPEWKMIWANDHELMAMSDGTESTYWFLSSAALDHVSLIEEKQDRFDFHEILNCGNCAEIIKGTMLLSQNNEVWIGLSTGLLILSDDGNWRKISGNEILSSAEESYEWRVLVSDSNGNIWVSHKDNLCFFDGLDWKCFWVEDAWNTYEYDGIQKDSLYNGIISAVEGQNKEIWFGTASGKIIWFDGNIFEVTNLHQELNIPTPSIGSLTYDEQTGSLWAINDKVEFPGQSPDPYIGVLQKTKNDEWNLYEKTLFMTDGDILYDHLTSVAITPDGTVWVAMTSRFGIAKFDGENWLTYNGDPLQIYEDISKPKIKTGCNLPDYRVLSIIATENGQLFLGNQIFAFLSQDIKR